MKASDCVVAVFAVAAVATVSAPIAAQDVPVTLRPEGALKPSEIALGQGADLPPIPYDEDRNEFATQLTVEHPLPEVYSLVFSYGDATYSLPVRLHRNSRPINLKAHFDGPEHCTERLVLEAEKRASPGNITDALRRYLLARHLSEINEERSRCRDTQPDRLAKARIERGIQLATFGGSPFLPPEADESEWERILGDRQAQAYRTQVVEARAIQLEEDRQAAISLGEFGKASEVNAVLIAQAEDSEEEERALRSVGLPRYQLEREQSYLETKARNRGQDYVLVSPGPQ